MVACKLHICLLTSPVSHNYCTAPFLRKTEGHSFFLLSVVCGSGFRVGTLWAQLLLQDLANCFETLQVI